MKLCLGTVAVSLGLFALGCGAQAPETSSSSEDDLSASKKTFVTVRSDARKCAAPMCGGYFVRDANKTTAEKYVASLDFSHSDLDQADIDAVLAAAPEEIVLQGKLGKIDATGTRPLLVYTAYVGMPGVSVAQGATFFTASARNPQIQCVTAPCNNLVATKLNPAAKDAPVDYTTTSTDGVVATNLDHAWLDDRVEAAGAIVAGALVPGQHMAGGDELVLAASQVFVKLPEVAGPCSHIAKPPCGGGEVMSYTRTTNRCLMPDHCVAQKPCAQLPLACGAGYHDVAWKVAGQACPKHACDPDFAN